MATKKIPKEPPAPASRNVMTMEGDPGQREQLLADVTARGVFASAVTMRTYCQGSTGDIGITEAVKALRTAVDEVKGGDLRLADGMLVGQACALNAIFAELARRAALNMGTHLHVTEAYMRLALKAQTQCRATLETLAAIKNPPVVFAKQANINNGGQQQVNNGGAPVSERPKAEDPARAHAEDSQKPRSELLEQDPLPANVSPGGVPLQTEVIRN